MTPCQAMSRVGFPKAQLRCDMLVQGRFVRYRVVASSQGERLVAVEVANAADRIVATQDDTT